MSVGAWDILSSLETSGLQAWAHASEDEKQHTNSEMAITTCFIEAVLHEFGI
jgi:hypothetical protein